MVCVATITSAQRFRSSGIGDHRHASAGHRRPGVQLLNIDARRLPARRRFANGTVSGQDDKLLSLDRRIVAGGAVGNTVVQSEEMTLVQFGALNYYGGKNT